MKRQVRKYLISLMWLIAVLALSHQALARTWYNLPTYSKVKITRDPHGQSWIYLEFMWGKEGAQDEQQTCKPNFEKGKAVEFEIVITPKCFIRPKGGRDSKYNCDEVMTPGYYNMPNDIIPGVGKNCYVDLWNYWNPTPDDVVSELHAACGFDSSGDVCAKVATASGVFLDPVGNFTVGLHDASALKAGVRYSIKYPVEINDSPECQTVPFSFDKSTVKQCSFATSSYLSDPVWEDPFLGYIMPEAGFGSLYTVHNDWGRAHITMSTFKNSCDLPWPCDTVDKAYTCPHLIGAVGGGTGCINADKNTDYWISRLCVPTGDREFTPGYGVITDTKGVCTTEQNSSDLQTHGVCCVDRDNDGYYGESGYNNGFTYVPVPTYGTRTGDCNDADATIHPGADEVSGDGIDSNCDGCPDKMCFSGPVDPCPANGQCNPGDQVKTLCPDGVNSESQICNDKCVWETVSDCPPDCPLGDYICTVNGVKICTDISTDSANCGWCGNKCPVAYSCVNNLCEPDSICAPGQTQNQSCVVNSQSGTQTRTCNANGQWDPWGSCVPNQVCPCNSGVCCDGCNYLSSSSSCDQSYVYQCEGSSPGQNGQQAVVTRFCSGYSSVCDGGTSQSAWQIWLDCNSAQQCQMSGGMPQCVPVTTCNDTYTAGSVAGACYGNPGTTGAPTICLELQQKSGAAWQFRACMQTGTFPQDFSIKILDLNHSSQNLGGPYANTVGNKCSVWRDFSVAYIPGYGSGNGAGIQAEMVWPIGCSGIACTYHSGTITITKSCL